MSPLPIRFTKDDFMMGKVMKPGYYHALVKGIVPKPAKSDASTVYNIQLKVVEKGENFGVPITDYMSEKALGIGGIRLVRALNGGNEPKPDENYDLENGRGKIVKIHVINEMYNGRLKNTVDDYDVPDSTFTLEEA
jgi:hypothetical protein